MVRAGHPAPRGQAEPAEVEPGNPGLQAPRHQGVRTPGRQDAGKSGRREERAPNDRGNGQPAHDVPEPQPILHRRRAAAPPVGSPQKGHCPRAAGQPPRTGGHAGPSGPRRHRRGDKDQRTADVGPPQQRRPPPKVEDRLEVPIRNMITEPPRRPAPHSPIPTPAR